MTGQEPFSWTRPDVYRAALLGASALMAMAVGISLLTAQAPPQSPLAEIDPYMTVAIVAAFAFNIAIQLTWPLRASSDTPERIAEERNGRASTLAAMTGLVAIGLGVAILKPELFLYSPSLGVVFAGLPAMAAAQQIRWERYSKLLDREQGP